MLFLFLLLVLFSFLPNPSHSSHCTTQILKAKSYQNCMSLPTQDASIAWTYHPANATLDVAFSGTFISPSGWVGWGVNPSAPAMIGSRILAAFPDPTTARLVLLPFVLSPSAKLQRSPLLSRPFDRPRLISSSASLHGGASAGIRSGASVLIAATLAFPSNSTTKLHMVWNRGLYVQGYSPTIHPTSPSDLASFTTLDLLSPSATAATTNALRTVHGAVNAAAWGVLLPGGAATARYLRHAEPTLGPAWFYAHMAVQLTGFALGAAGFGLGLRLGPGPYTLHRRLGFAAVGLGAVQTLALFFRPKTSHRFRRYWKSYHHMVGYACVVVGVVNVFQGFEAMGQGRSYAKLGYCLVLAGLVGACVSLEVNSWVLFCRKAKEEKMRRESLISGGGGGGGGSDKGSGIMLHSYNRSSG